MDMLAAGYQKQIRKQAPNRRISGTGKQAEQGEIGKKKSLPSRPGGTDWGMDESDLGRRTTEEPPAQKQVP